MRCPEWSRADDTNKLAVRPRRLEQVALTLHFLGNACPWSGREPLPAKIISIATVAEGIGATAEQQTSKESKSKTKEHKLEGCIFDNRQTTMAAGF